MARSRTTPIRLVGWLTMLAGVVFAALSVVARPAEADPAIATVNGRAGGWMGIQLEGMGGFVDAGPVSMSINGSSYAGYCIDFHNGIDLSKALTYEERTWGSGNFPSPLALSKVNWILHNSYPNVSAAAIAAAAGVDPATPDLENVVGAATQASIWYFSDGINIAEAEKTTAVGLVVAYLTGPTNVGLNEPAPADVQIVEDSATGSAGALIGPFTIASTAGSVTLTSDNPSVGFMVNGVVTNTANDGDQVFGIVPGGTAPGSATITASGNAKVPSGRIFVNQAAPDSTQKLILAAAANTTYADTATLNWAGGADPKATAVKDCAAGGFQVTLTNDGTADTDFVITDKGTAVGSPVTVKAGESKNVFVPITTGDTYELKATAGATVIDLGSGTFDCDAPAPDADATPDCAQGGVKVTLTNSGKAEATFVITNKGVNIGAPVKVAAGASTEVVVPVADGEAYEIVVSSGTYSEKFEGTLTCGTPHPVIEIKEKCAAGGVEVVMSNASGTAEATFVVTNSGAAVDTVKVAAGATTSIVVPVAEDAAYDIKVVSGTTEATAAGTLDCDKPAPSATAVPDCAQGGVVVTLTNTGTAEANFTITNSGAAVGSIKVAAGGSEKAVVALANGATYDITVTAEGYSQNFKGTYTCGEAQPQVLFNEKCASGGVEVVLSNTAGTAAASFTVTNNGTKVADVSVPAGESRTQLVAVAEDAAYDIVVTSGAAQLGRKGGVLNCFTAEPSAVVSTNCVVGAEGMLVTLRNTGTQDVTYTVANNGTNIATGVAVKAGGTNSVLVPMSNGAAYSIVATPSAGTAQTFTGTYLCSVPSTTLPFSNPGAAVVDSCADNGVAVTVSNTGSKPATFVIVSGADKVAEITNLVGTDRVVVPITEGTGYTIRVTATGGFDQTFTGTRVTCTTTTVAPTTTTPVVLGTIVNTPDGPVQTVIPTNEGALPRTGGNTTSFLILAMVLLGLGGGLLVIQDVLGGRKNKARS